MTFMETLDEHLRAVRDRDFTAFAQTVDPDEVVLVTAEGDYLTDSQIFLERHLEWFSIPDWSVEPELLHHRESANLATCVLRLQYLEGKGDDETPQVSVLSLVFARRGGRWLLVQDQNTPQRG